MVLPQNDFCPYFKMGLSLGSSQEALVPLGKVPGLPMIDPITYTSTFNPIHLKVSTQKWHLHLFHKGIELGLNTKGMRTTGNCSKVTIIAPITSTSTFNPICPMVANQKWHFSPKKLHLHLFQIKLGFSPEGIRTTGKWSSVTYWVSCKNVNL